jgi:hypothetical protein
MLFRRQKMLERPGVSNRSADSAEVRRPLRAVAYFTVRFTVDEALGRKFCDPT